MRFAKNVFLIAGLWGVITLTPLYFAFDWIGQQDPPGITHPDFYFGFIGLALAWQAAFFVIATNPVRFRPIMLAAILEKFGYLLTIAALSAQGRLHGGQLAFAAPDLILGSLFIAAYLKTNSSPSAANLRA